MPAQPERSGDDVMREGLLLGVDVGTSSTKGVLVDAAGTVVATVTRPHALSTPRPGWAEHDAESVWWADFLDVVGELLRTVRVDGRAPDIAGVGVSGIGPCVLAADTDARPLRPAILYGIDTRAVDEIDELTDRYGAEHILDRCGSPLTSQAVGPKLAWLRRHEPDTYAATRRIFMASSLLVHRLTGAYILDHHSASQCAPLYERHRNGWITEWAEDIAPGIELPELAWPGEIVGRVSATAAEQTGIPRGTPVIAGTVDAWAEATSVGVTAPGDVMLMYGTTMFLVEIQDDRRTWPTLWGTAGVFPGSWCLAAGMATSGAVTDWLRRLTGASYTELTEQAASVGRGGGGLVMLPYFAGERTPLFDPDARGIIAGLTLAHGPGHLYRAALEATAYGVRHNLEAMRAAGGQDKRLVAVGGGTRGGLWTQIVSDVLQQPQQLPRHTVGACYGDALLAGIATGLVEDPARWNPVETVIEPDPEAATDYDRLYRLYRELYPRTRDTAHTLAAVQTGRPAPEEGSPCVADA